MKTSEDPQNIEDIQSSSQASSEIQHNHQNTLVAEVPGANSGSSSNAISQNRNVSREDIELVQNLIERCLQLYMNKGEVIRTLSSRARIEPAFTTLVWKKLEEENSEFFRAYYIRLTLKRQIILFNRLLEHQCHLMKNGALLPNVPVALHNVNTVPIGYPVLHQPAMTVTRQPHFDPNTSGLPSCHVVNGIPAQRRYHPIYMKTENDTVMDGGTAEAAPAAVPRGATSSMSEMAASPASVASNNHFPFIPPEISGMSLDATHDTAVPPGGPSTGDLQLDQACALGSSSDPLGSLEQLWDLNVSDLTADLANLGDLGAFEDYTGSPFLPSDSEILLDSPEQDDRVEEYFANAAPTVPPSQPDEEKES